MLHKMYHIMSRLIIGRLSHCLKNGALYDQAIRDSIDRKIQRISRREGESCHVTSGVYIAAFACNLAATISRLILPHLPAARMAKLRAA